VTTCRWSGGQQDPGQSRRSWTLRRMTPSSALAPSFSGRLKEEKSMRDVFSRVHRFVVSEDGPTAVEYAVLMGLIVVAIAAAVSNLAKSISGTFSAVSSTLGAS
jgi:pilus assembly protein Flp/PilA